MEMTRNDMKELLEEHVIECQKVATLTYVKKPSVFTTLMVALSLVGSIVACVYSYWAGINGLNETLGKKIEDQNHRVQQLETQQKMYQQSMEDFRAYIKDELQSQKADLKLVLNALRSRNGSF